MGTHVGFDEGCAAERYDVADGAVENVCSDNALAQRNVRCWLMAAAAHHDQTLLGKAHEFGERQGCNRAVDDAVGEVSLDGCIVARNLEPRRPVDKQHELAPERGERNPWVWPEAALACDSHTGMRFKLEGRGDLGARSVELRAGPLNLSGEGPESVGIEGLWHNAIEPKRLGKQRGDHAFLAMHGGDHCPFAGQPESVAIDRIEKRVAWGISEIGDRHGA
ncbi:hypothetical protein VE25_19030 [Devosia geojensis]|uniref:Uncharacterized protein n=1 Tax=Devosia geojensis TaxID=443610 RepID=A0A0F5FEC1_9HYPH|nr:hypothetical protein VE25_19030 [Devosia geojensis]